MNAEPIVAGFHPDPSICRVDDRYYLVNSSFEYLPGLPIHTSTDLVNWRQIGNALTRPGQIEEHSGGPSVGIFAPTIRHHDDRFWIVTTNVLDLMRGRGHFIITAEHAEGPWSDPIWVDGAHGIDPDLCWDEHGVCHLTWSSTNPALPGIVSAPIDPTTGTLLAEPHQLWQGSGLAHPEGPHLYRTGGWWYLLLAEGGTERGHASTIARTRVLDEPFEAAPSNPMLTHRSTAHPVQSVGHADLVELAGGSWAAVHLGTRPRGGTPGFHVNGRETFLVGINWVDGWPVAVEDRFAVKARNHSFVERFDADELDARWVGAGRFPTSFVRRLPSGGVAIDAPPLNSAQPDDVRRSVLATRVRAFEWTAEAVVGTGEGAGRFVLRIDDDHSYDLAFDAEGVTAQLRIGPVVHTVERIALTSTSPVRLRISAVVPDGPAWGGQIEQDVIVLAAVNSDGSEHVFGTFNGRYLSTEVAGRFTGRMIAVESLTGSIELHSVSVSEEVPRT